MSIIHLGLVVIKGVSKTAFELALEYYAGKIIKKGNHYSAHHINELCTKESPEFIDNYAIRAKGYCDIEEAIKKVESSSTQMAKDIVSLIIKIHEDDDFTIIDLEQAVVQSLETTPKNITERSMATSEPPSNCVIL